MPMPSMPMTSMAEPALFDHIVGVLGIAFPILGALTVRKTIQETKFDRKDRINGFWANGAILFGIGGLVVLAWWLADRGSPGLTQSPQNQLVANTIIAVYLAYYVYDVWHSTHSKAARAKARAGMKKNTPFMPRSWGELPHALFLCAAAGVGEELLFRAHLIAWIQAIGGDHPIVTVLAVGIPGLLFALAHRYQENRAVVHIAIMAWVFGTYFLLTGSILLLVVLHFLVDAFGSVLGILLIPEDPAAADENEPEAAIPSKSPDGSAAT